MLLMSAVSIAAWDSLRRARAQMACDKRKAAARSILSLVLAPYVARLVSNPPEEEKRCMG
jgi:hypothetical protein